jgi:hypothetical protein
MGGGMLAFLDSARRYLWAFVELGFLAVLAIVLVYLLLGESSGAFVRSVVDNVTRFTTEVPTASLIGIAVLLAIIYLVTKRLS